MSDNTCHHKEHGSPNVLQIHFSVHFFLHLQLFNSLQLRDAFGKQDQTGCARQLASKNQPHFVMSRMGVLKIDSIHMWLCKMAHKICCINESCVGFFDMEWTEKPYDIFKFCRKHPLDLFTYNINRLAAVMTAGCPGLRRSVIRFTWFVQ